MRPKDLARSTFMHGRRAKVEARFLKSPAGTSQWSAARRCPSFRNDVQSLSSTHLTFDSTADV